MPARLFPVLKQEFTGRRPGKELRDQVVEQHQRRSMAWNRHPCAAARSRRGENPFLQGIPFGLQIAEGGTDEYAE
jgi:hypothetical protein